uniref:Phosphoinositide-3-kinase, regulatory subunit 6b n=1 Tax=Salarias fasciatus TaxID=181472 RepID=A0A672GXK9_SALFA
PLKVNIELLLRASIQFLARSHQSSMLTWTLQKKVEADPSCSISLINVLLNELEKKQQRVCKTQKFKSYMSIMPVLHTLYYVSGVTIPNSLYQRVSECLTKLLILPLPYSAVVQQTLRSISMEMITPGCLYQTRVIAEQNIKNEHFNLQEKVFVLADPAVFSASLESTLRAYLDVSDSLRNTHMVERKVVLHVLCSGLETACQNTNLARALEALDNKTARKYFHDVVLAVSQSTNHGAGGRADYLNTLQEIYQRITSGAEGTVVFDYVPSERTEINFLLWNDEEDLCELKRETNARVLCFLIDDSGKDEDDSNKRDSGIEKDINDQGNTTLPFNRQSALKRRNAYRTVKSAENLDLVKEKIEGSSGSSAGLKEERSHTARVVVLGDDRALGRLARAYSSIEKESKRNMLTKKLNLQLYYIPVSDVKPSLQPSLSLASHLGRVDPWYNSDISNLGAAISNLSEMVKSYRIRGPSELNLFLLDSLCYYLRCGTQSVNLPLYSVKVHQSNNSVVFYMHINVLMKLDFVCL